MGGQLTVTDVSTPYMPDANPYMAPFGALAENHRIQSGAARDARISAGTPTIALRA